MSTSSVEQKSENGGGSTAEAPPITRSEFGAVFDRQFDRTYSYVSRRIECPGDRKRIVAEVLISHLHLLVLPDGVDERRVAIALKEAADRVIERATAVGVVRRDPA